MHMDNKTLAKMRALSGGGGADGTGAPDYLAMRANGTLTEYTSEEVTSIANYAFCACSSLAKVNLPLATSVGNYAFRDCAALTEVTLPAVKIVGQDAFEGCTALTEVNLPLATSVGGSAFYGCTALTEVNLPAATAPGYQLFRNCAALAAIDLPAATSVGNYAFYGCTALTEVNLPLATSVGEQAFRDCAALAAIDLPAVARVSAYAFLACSVLTALVLRRETAATLSNTNALSNTPIASGTGYIYVPAALVETYKAATNWSTYADQIRAIEDYPEICGVVVDDLAVAVRMDPYYDAATSTLEFQSANARMILCSSAENGAGAFTTRENTTVYLIPVPETATRVTVKTTDTSVASMAVQGFNSNGDGTFTRAFDTALSADLFCAFTAGAAEYITIVLEYADGASVDWGYDVNANIVVAFD